MNDQDTKSLNDLMDMIWRSQQRDGAGKLSYWRIMHELKVTRRKLDDLMTLAAIKFPSRYSGLFPVTPGDSFVHVTSDPDEIVLDVAPRLLTGNTKYARANAGMSVAIESVGGRSQYLDLMTMVREAHNNMKTKSDRIKEAERTAERNIRQRNIRQRIKF